jgi:hypothetical protein
MRVYLSGKITDEPNYKQNFAEAEEEVKKTFQQGTRVINPVKVGEKARRKK